MVGHLTREYSRIAWYFLTRGGSISVEANSHHQHCKRLCGGMEIPCWVTFTCSRKATLNWLKALLKVVIYANVWHGVQMFSQISRIPDLIRKFWAKKCGLYTGVYGSLRPSWLGLCEGGEEIISKKMRRGVVFVIGYQKYLVQDENHFSCFYLSKAEYLTEHLSQSWV